MVLAMVCARCLLCKELLLSNIQCSVSGPGADDISVLADDDDTTVAGWHMSHYV